MPALNRSRETGPAASQTPAAFFWNFEVEREQLNFLLGSRNGACFSPSPINAYRVELALCLCFCLMTVNEKRGQRGALIANVGNRGNLPEGGARERADGEQPT